MSKNLCEEIVSDKFNIPTWDEYYSRPGVAHSLLLNFIKTNDVDRIKHLLSRNTPIDITNPEYLTEALMCFRFPIVEFLLEKIPQEKLNDTSNKFFYFSCHSSDKNLLDYMLSHKRMSEAIHLNKDIWIPKALKSSLYTQQSIIFSTIFTHADFQEIIQKEINSIFGNACLLKNVKAIDIILASSFFSVTKETRNLVNNFEYASVLIENKLLNNLLPVNHYENKKIVKV